MHVVHEGSIIDEQFSKHMPLQHPSLGSMHVYHAHFRLQARNDKHNHLRVERCGLPFAYFKLNIAATPRFHHLATLKGKESKNPQEHLARLETLLDPKLHQHIRNNHPATLDYNKPHMSTSRTKHLEKLESHFKA
jgi:hypothetical protein